MGNINIDPTLFISLLITCCTMGMFLGVMLEQKRHLGTVRELQTLVINAKLLAAHYQNNFAELRLRLMGEQWKHEVQVGDQLEVIPLWNETTAPGTQRFTNPVKVEAVVRGTSQSGIMFSVRNNGGVLRTLDAAWFEPVRV